MTKVPEEIVVTESANTYEDAISGAMIKLKNKIAPDAQVFRTAAHCEELRDWYVESTECQLSAGEQLIMVVVTFQLAGTDI